MSTSVASFQFLRDLVYKRSAIVVEQGKEYLVESRLGPLARREGFAGIDELVVALRRDSAGDLTARVVEAMTTNETSFFRDIHPFEALRGAIVPKLLESRAASKTLRIWCAAASTGQEPYSIAMTLRDHFPELAAWNVQILATDINKTVLARAREGLYKQLEVNRGLPATALVKHFDRVGTDWQVKESLRRMISFQELNLLDRWPLFTAQDVVFMRNVLIYFDVQTKRSILERVRQNLRPDGYLLLGGAETTVNIDDGFGHVRAGQTVYYQPRPAAEKKVANASG